MLAGRYAPAWITRHATPAAPSWPARHAIVIGAGLAGAAVARALALRGWRVDVIEREMAPARAASGLHAGVFQPHVSSDDGILSRVVRAGYLYALAEWAAIERAGGVFAWAQPGALSLAVDAAHEARMGDAMTRLGFPEAFARTVSRDQAAGLAGASVAHGGSWFPSAGWMRSSSLVTAQLDTALPAQRVHLMRYVAALRWTDSMWEAIDGSGAIIVAAPVVVLANSDDASRLADFGRGAAQTVRGQLSYIPAPPFAAPRAVVGGGGYVLPGIAGVSVAGASFERDNEDPCPDATSRDANLARVERLLPGSTERIDAASVRGAVAFRCTTADRLPMLGRVVDAAAARADAATLTAARGQDLRRAAGLYAAFAYGSRGLVWAALAGEIIGCELDGEPAPLERSLLDAMDPGRFLVKHLRHGTL
jgi:tRNA 5-methylaminomethyl-2-thiouridine biosynthesis bifunctional protein